MSKPRQKLFDRWLWSYVPSSIEGSAMMMLFIIIWLGALFLAIFLSDFVGEVIAGLLAAIIMVPTTIIFFRFVHKHS